MLKRYKSPLLLALVFHVVRNLMTALLDQQPFWELALAPRQLLSSLLWLALFCFIHYANTRKGD